MQALKIAGLLAAWEKSVCVTEKTALYALKYAYGYHNALLRIYDRVGMSAYQLSCEELYDVIASQDGIAEVDLRRRFAMHPKAAFNGMIEQLRSQGRIKRGLDKVLRVKL
jgi:hypothetical protein